MFNSETLQRFADELIVIYKKHGFDPEGEYDYYGCNQPCCNPLASKFPKFEKALNKWMQENKIEYDPFQYSGPTDYPSIARVIELIEKTACEHTWTLRGASSVTSAGPMDLYGCPRCHSTKYERGNNPLPKMLPWV